METLFNEIAMPILYAITITLLGVVFKVIAPPLIEFIKEKRDEAKQKKNNEWETFLWNRALKAVAHVEKTAFQKVGEEKRRQAADQLARFVNTNSGFNIDSDEAFATIDAAFESFQELQQNNEKIRQENGKIKRPSTAPDSNPETKTDAPQDGGNIRNKRN